MSDTKKKDPSAPEVVLYLGGIALVLLVVLTLVIALLVACWRYILNV